MIKILDNPNLLNTILEEYQPGSIEKKILDILYNSTDVYTYASVNQIEFELKLRKNIVQESYNLHKSKFSFRVFRKSKCNSDFWHRTDEGGFLLENGVKPSEAIKDIYIHSSEYGTECATAIVIVFYKALLDSFPEELFNQLFSEIYLMNWQHLDNDLGLTGYDNIKDYLPGDCRYFKNPDVDPQTPEWQGENVYDLGNGTYYGHGIGIGSSQNIIDELNKNRIEDATVSAYLLDFATRPNFKYLANKNNKYINIS